METSLYHLPSIEEIDCVGDRSDEDTQDTCVVDPMIS